MITIFVSSTFKDMQAERDALQQTVAPILNETARKYGKSISFSDLRWGVNTLDLDSEKGARKVLDVCLDEIDRCEPPMIVILGYRYGWIPSQDTLKNSVERKKLILQDLNMSVTALEIEYGAMCRPERTLFYFREIDNDAPEKYLGEDEEHIQKLNELKRRIENLAGRNLRTYHMKWNGQKLEGIDEFAKLVEEDVLRLLQPEWARDKNLTPFERERNTQWTFVREKSSYFRAKLPLLEELVQKVQNGAEKLIIKGASGMGKSTLICSLAVKLKALGYDVLPFIGGYTLESNDAFDILKNAVYYIEKKLSLDHFADVAGEAVETGRKQATVKDWRNRLDEVCGLLAATGVKLVIMLDAADQLNDDDNRNDLVFIPYNLSKSVRFIMTCTDDFPILGDCIALSPLDKTDRKEIIKGILSPINKELDERVVEEIVSKKGAGNPLYISLLVQRLLLLRADDFEKMSDPQTISAHQREILSSCPDELEGMSAALFKEAGTHINGKLIQQCMEYIAASRHGLRICDLAALLDGQWNYLDFIHFVYYMNDSFMVRDDGRYDFTHKSLRNGLSKTGNKSAVFKKLADHFLGLPPSDEIKINELGYHLIKDNRYGELVECVNRFGDEDRALRNALSYDLFEQSCLDGGQWVLNVLQSAKEYGAGVNFCLFIGEEMVVRFNSSRKDLETAERIMLEDIALLEEYNNVNKDYLQAADGVMQTDIPETEESLTSFTDLMNNIMGEMFKQGLIELPEGCEGMTAEDLHIGIDDFKETVAQTGGLKNFMLQTSTGAAYSETVTGNRHDVLALSSCYRILSKIYSYWGDLDRLNKAINIRERSILLNQALLSLDGEDLLAAILLCTDYSAAVKLYVSAGTAEYRAKAEQTADTAMELAKEIDERLRDLGVESIGAMSMSDCLSTLADMRSNSFNLDMDKIKEQIDLYKQALDALQTMEDGEEKLCATAELYNKLAHTYRQMSVLIIGDESNKELSYDYYFKSTEICERLYKEKPDPDILDSLARSYEDLAWNYGIDEEYQKAIVYHKKTIALRKILHEKLNSNASALKLATAYSELADVYLENQDEDKYAEALAAHEEYLKLVLELEKKNKTVEAKRQVSAAYNTLAQTYQIIGGEENLKIGYELLKKRKSAERRLEIETGVLCDLTGATQNLQSLVDAVNEMEDGSALFEELIAIGEEDIQFYTKASDAGQENGAQVLEEIQYLLANVYADLDDERYLKRAMELFKIGASHATDFFDYYASTTGMAKILKKSGRKEDGLKAISLCKDVIAAADLEHNAEAIKSDSLRCTWIMDTADNLADLLAEFLPHRRKEIKYYKAMADEYRQAMFEASGFDDDDEDNGGGDPYDFGDFDFLNDTDEDDTDGD